MTPKKFIIYSLAVHAIVIAILFVIHPAKTKRTRGDFHADLVTPEELRPKRPSLPPEPARRQPMTPRPKAVAPTPRVSAPKTRPEENTTQNVQKSSPTESRNSTAISPPTEHKIIPGGAAAEHGAQPPIGQDTGKPKNVVPDLFDRKIIGGIVRKNIEKSEKTVNKDRPVTLDTKDYRFWAYNQRLKESIEGVWHYPQEAARKGIHGDLIIKFTIEKNGHLGAIELVRGSGYPVLDNAALDALKEASPYWPLPKEWGMEAYTIQGNFVYNLSNSFIR